jgi:hypothetical protein
MRVGACLQRVPYTSPLFGRATKVGLEQGLAAYYHVYAMPKKFVPQSRAPRSRREVKPPQQPHIVSFRLSPSEFEKLESHVEAIGVSGGQEAPLFGGEVAVLDHGQGFRRDQWQGPRSGP